MSFRFVAPSVMSEFKKNYEDKRKRDGYPKVEGIVDGLWYKYHREDVCGGVEIFRI